MCCDDCLSVPAEGRVELVKRAQRLIMAIASRYRFISPMGLRLNTAVHRAKVRYWGRTSHFTTDLELPTRRDEAVLPLEGQVAGRVVA